MTAESSAPTPDVPGSGTPRQRTHRTLSADEITKRFEHKPAVAAWILAVRAELELEFGEVDTYSRFAQRIKEKRPKCTKDLRQLRRMASEQLTKAPGPSSVLAEHVLALVVSDERRPGVRQRFGQLYTAARNEPAPFAPAPPPDPAPDPVPVPVEALQPGAATTGELRELVTELRQMIEAAEEREAALRAELATRAEENNLLRLNLSAMTATSSTRPRPAPAGPADDPGAVPVPVQRPSTEPDDGGWPATAPPDRYAALAALNQQPTRSRRRRARRRLDHPGKDDLEMFWLGGIWADLRHPPVDRDGLDPREVASQFDAIARTLQREGVGASVTEPPPEPAPLLSEDQPPPVQATPPAPTPAPQRTPGPHRWTSRGPVWFYAMLGAIVMAGVSVVTVVSILATLHPEPAYRDDDNLVVTLTNDQYP
jgi:hypothetical protein